MLIENIFKFYGIWQEKNQSNFLIRAFVPNKSNIPTIREAYALRTKLSAKR